MVGQATLLLGAFLVGELARVATLAGRTHAQVQELAAQRFDLLAGFRAHVETFHRRTEPARGGDRLQPGHAGTDDQHLGRTDGAGGGGQHREEARRQLGGDQHRLVAGHAGLGTEHVHGLGAGGARQAFQREGLDGARLQGGTTGLVGLGMQGADQGGALPEPGDGRRRWRLHAQDQLGAGARIVAGQLRTGVDIGLVGDARAQPGTGFHVHPGTGGDQLLHRFRRGRHTLLARRGLLQHQHLHRHAFLVTTWIRTPMLAHFPGRRARRREWLVQGPR